MSHAIQTGSSVPGPPREGLPQCIRAAAVLGDCQAVWHDNNFCADPEPVHDIRFAICASAVTGDERMCGTRLYRWGCNPVGVQLMTDDEDEAIAAYERGERWLRGEVRRP
jgi:hypothetical protein